MMVGAIAFLVLGFCAGCNQGNTYVAPPPAKVTVGVPQRREVTTYHEYTGTTQASDSVELRARVSGYLESIQFKDGATVPQGLLLFVIDRRPFLAQLDQAKAELQARKATETQQQSIYQRDQSLLPKRAISQQQVDIDRGNWLVAQAGVRQAEASLRQAELNLDYTEIRASIAGRIGRRLVDAGNLVTADSTLLTTITSYDPMYAYFTVSEANYLDYLKRRRASADRTEATASASSSSTTPSDAAGTTSRPPTPLEVGLANEPDYPHRGYIDFAEPTVDPNTGTLLLRGVLANPQPYYLAPGLFVRVRVPVSTRPDALVVPDSALGTDQAGRFLLVVGRDNVVQRRAVEAGQLVGDERVIEQGIRPGERFVVDGLQRARPGSEVAPVTASEERPKSPGAEAKR